MNRGDPGYCGCKLVGLPRNAADIPGKASGLGRSGLGNEYCPSGP